MKTSIVASFVALSALSVVATGCASDPNKNLKDAHANESEHKLAGQEGQAERTKEVAVAGANADKDHAQNRAEALPAGTSERVSAQAEMGAARETFRASAQERLDKLVAKLQESKRKVDIAGAKAPMTVASRIEAGKSHVQMVQTELGASMKGTDDAFGQNKALVEKHLRELEVIVNELQTTANDIKR